VVLKSAIKIELKTRHTTIQGKKPTF